MNIKKHYLIKVWALINNNVHKGTSEHNEDGFHLAQEKIIKCYDKDIKNISVAKGYRATYEEYKETHKTK